MFDKTPFRTEVRVTATDTTLLILGGDLDYDTAPELASLVRELLPGQMRNLDLDLAGLEFIDSSGVAALINVYNAAAEHDIAMRMVALTPYLRHLLRVTALDRLFRLPQEQE